MDNSIATATNSGGGTVVSFGSGDRTPGGRTARSAQGRAGATNASRAQISSLRGRIRRQGTTGRSRAARERRALLERLDGAASRGGNIRRRVLANIARDLAALNG